MFMRMVDNNNNIMDIYHVLYEKIYYIYLYYTLTTIWYIVYAYVLYCVRQDVFKFIIY